MMKDAVSLTILRIILGVINIVYFFCKKMSNKCVPLCTSDYNNKQQVLMFKVPRIEKENCTGRS